MLILNLKTELRKTAPIKSYFLKSCFASFFKITFQWWTFSQFCLQIWNQRKVLQFLVPMMTDLKKESFFVNILFVFYLLYTPLFYEFISVCPSMFLYLIFWLAGYIGNRQFVTDWCIGNQWVATPKCSGNLEV